MRVCVPACLQTPNTKQYHLVRALQEYFHDLNLMDVQRARQLLADQYLLTKFKVGDGWGEVCLCVHGRVGGGVGGLGGLCGVECARIHVQMCLDVHERV